MFRVLMADCNFTCSYGVLRGFYRRSTRVRKAVGALRFEVQLGAVGFADAEA